MNWLRLVILGLPFLYLSTIQDYHCHKHLQACGSEISISFLLRVNLHEQREKKQ
ncbi:hypothetical protein J7E52_11030 [Bacillus sp. ISL-34]|uniref:hypothetical protein n=1 Tax=Bacillus sp. ISL-34 TaxID=2819121 RepID=UPI001BE6825E|nr:hypothetical protein [Bacillus sp. ISL-34]MBT2647251.1 hypothetical protein [Bacillus sp. ISL-34]